MKHIKPVLFAIAFGLICSAQFADAKNYEAVNIEIGRVSPFLSQVCAKEADPKACIINVVTELKFAKQVGRTEAYCEVYDAQLIHNDKYDKYCTEFRTNVDVKDLENWIGKDDEKPVK